MGRTAANSNRAGTIAGGVGVDGVTTGVAVGGTSTVDVAATNVCRGVAVGNGTGGAAVYGKGVGTEVAALWATIF
ncbi:MAG: hypothetical protein NVS4B2_29730 [Chloroflexota bacterium]